MSEKTRCVKTKNVSGEEATNYLLDISALLNEISQLEEKKSNINKSLNAQIKSELDKLEKIRIMLNDGVVETLYNFMDKDTHEIIWKDEDGNEIERTPFDEKDWEIYENQYGPSQKPLFKDDQTEITDQNVPALYEGEIIDADSEDIAPSFDEQKENESEGDNYEIEQ